jgi:hypothetical protein
MNESEKHELMLEFEELAQFEGLRNFAKSGTETNITSENQKLIDSKADDNDVIKHDGSVGLTDDWTTGYKITADQIASSIAVGTAPLEVVSTTVVANLNADLLDGVHADALEPTLTKGNLSAGSTKISIGGTGTGSVIGAGVTVDVAQSNLDHGSIGGLGDDDHSQYLRADSTRALSADWDIGDTRMIQADKIRARDGAGLALFEDGGKGILVQDGGYVGVGTATPQRLLHLYGNVAGYTPVFGATLQNINNTLGYVDLQLLSDISDMRFGTGGTGTTPYGGPAGSGYLGMVSNYGLIFATNNTVRVYIKNSGEVGIGTTAPSAKLAINGGLAVGEDADPGDNNLKVVGNAEIDGALNHDGTTVGFYGTAPVSKPTITGSKGGNVALASLITALVSLGLIIDNTT